MGILFADKARRAWGCIHNTLFSSYLTNGPNKLEFFIKSGSKRLPETNLSLLDPFISYEEIEVL